MHQTQLSPMRECAKMMEDGPKLQLYVVCYEVLGHTIYSHMYNIEYPTVFMHIDISYMHFC